jgi:integrase/recombinase XerD
MLESFFTYRAVLDRIRRGPLAHEIDAIADDLARTGYSRKTGKRYLSLMGTFSRYALRVGCAGPECIDGALVERFLVEVPASASMRSLAYTAVRHAMQHLERRYPPHGASPRTDEPDTALLTAFEAHLRDVRGLQRRSCDDPVRVARRMLRWYRDCRPGRSLSALCGEDILAVVGHIAAACVADSTRSAAVSHVRSFLRYLRWEGVLHEDLAPIVPRVPCWRLARVPFHLTWPEVRAVIDAIAPGDPARKRDRALLLLLATTGLRNQEVRRLQISDVHWRTSELHVRHTKGRRERVLPLLEDAGKALADYVLHGRPRGMESTLFLRHVPPAGPLRCSSTLAAIVRRRLARCGIQPRRAGAHLLRHSLATRMVHQARPIKEVADLLGHRSIDTTTVYVKVALPQLEGVALPFPGGEA